MEAKKKELTDDEYIELINQAWYEKKVNNKVVARCPMCNDIIEVELLGNSARTRCSCGYMTASLRGL